MSTVDGTPRWYVVEDGAKHVRQLVLLLPAQSDVPPCVKNVVPGGAAGVAFLGATWAATVAFLDDRPPEAEGPYLFAKATNAVHSLRKQPVSVAFAFYRMKLGAVFQVFVQVETPQVKSAIGDRYVAERPFDLDSPDEIKMAEALMSRDVLDVCFVALGEHGPCTGYFGLRVPLPKEVREKLTKEFARLLEYDKGLSGRHPKGAIDQYNRENPMEDTPVLSPPLETKAFVGKTEAQAIREIESTGVEPATILETRTSREAQSKTAIGTGPDQHSATEDAKASVPKDAVDVASPRTVQQGDHGSGDVKADTESEARSHGRRLLPKGAQFKGIQCTQPPRNGFLGLGKKPGHWTVTWEKPFRVEIAYRLLPEVTVTWLKQQKD